MGRGLRGSPLPLISVTLSLDESFMAFWAGGEHFFYKYTGFKKQVASQEYQEYQGKCSPKHRTHVDRCSNELKDCHERRVNPVKEESKPVKVRSDPVHDKTIFRS